MSDSRKFIYPSTGSMNILTPLPSKIPKMLYPLPHAVQIPKLLTPPPLQNFQFFSDPLEFLFDGLKFIVNGQLALFPLTKKILLTIFSQARSNSSVSMFNTVHHSFPFKVLSLKLLTNK